MIRILGIIACAAVLATVLLHGIGFFTEAELRAFLNRNEWIRYAAAPIAALIIGASFLCWLAYKRESRRIKSRTPYTGFALLLVAFIAAGCATGGPLPAKATTFTPPPRPAQPAPSIVVEVPEAVRALFYGKTVRLDVDNHHLSEAAKDYVSTAGGEILFDRNTHLEIFARIIPDRVNRTGVSSSTIGGAIARHVIRSAEAVLGGVTVNGSHPLSSSSYDVPNVTRFSAKVEIWELRQDNRWGFRGQGISRIDCDDVYGYCGEEIRRAAFRAFNVLFVKQPQQPQPRKP